MLLNGLYENGVARCINCRYYEGDAIRGFCKRREIGIGHEAVGMFPYEMSCTRGEVNHDGENQDAES